VTTATIATTTTTTTTIKHTFVVFELLWTDHPVFDEWHSHHYLI
jgi:hypothetical protein